MRKKDDFDEMAEHLVFHDLRAQTALLEHDDQKLADLIAEYARKNFFWRLPWDPHRKGAT